MCGSHEHDEGKEAYARERIEYGAPVRTPDIQDSYSNQSISDSVISSAINYSINIRERESYSHSH